MHVYTALDETPDVSDSAARFSQSGVSAGDNFGEAIGNAGDVNQDGYDDLVIGIPGADAPDVNAGAARVYSGLDNDLPRQRRLAAASAARNEQPCGEPAR